MKIRAQDLKPFMAVRQHGGPIIRLEEVHIFEERKSPYTGIGKAQAYFPACVMVVWNDRRCTHTFYIDEELERVFAL